MGRGKPIDAGRPSVDVLTKIMVTCGLNTPSLIARSRRPQEVGQIASAKTRTNSRALIRATVMAPVARRKCLFPRDLRASHGVARLVLPMARAPRRLF
jgi:hypothetical protein